MIECIVKQLLESLQKKCAAAAAHADCRCATGLTTCDFCRRRRSLSPKVEPRPLISNNNTATSLLINTGGRNSGNVVPPVSTATASTGASPMIMWQLQGSNGLLILSSAGGQTHNQILTAGQTLDLSTVKQEGLTQAHQTPQQLESVELRQIVNNLKSSNNAHILESPSSTNSNDGPSPSVPTNHMDTDLHSLNFDLDDLLDLPSFENISITQSSSQQQQQTATRAAAR